MHIRVAAGAATLAVAMAWGVPQAQAQITVNLHPGDFTYQFADPITGLPITTLAIPTVGGSAKVAVYLIQNNDPASTPQNLIQPARGRGPRGSAELHRWCRPSTERCYIKHRSATGCGLHPR